MASWYFYNEEPLSLSWCRIIDDASIEAAFANGKHTYETDTYKFDFQSMIAHHKDGFMCALFRKIRKRKQTTILPWLYEFAQGEYLPMSLDVSDTLSKARKAKFKSISITHKDTMHTSVFDLIAMVEENVETGQRRTISPAPLFTPKSSHSSSLAVPREMTCAITQEVMIDPVMAEDGHSYERNAIEEWFSTGRIRSPVTGVDLQSVRLYPNHNLRNAITTLLESESAQAHHA